MRNASLTPYQPLPLIPVLLSLLPLPPSVSVTQKKVPSYVFTLIINPSYLTAVVLEPVTIGLRQSYYSNVEGQGPVEICIAALSGDFTGTNYTIDYTTVDGLARGKYLTH